MTTGPFPFQNYKYRSLFTYLSVYPPAFTDAYVKANNLLYFYGYVATDPSTSLTGVWDYTSWLNTSTGNERFHIDLGAPVIINKLYLENGHASGTYTNVGVKNFTFWGSNSSTAFSELTYGIDTDWIQLTTDKTQWAEHVAADVVDPQYVYVTNSTAYRYYAFKFADNWGNGSWISIRRIELQERATSLPGKSVRLTSVSDQQGLNHENSFLSAIEPQATLSIWVKAPNPTALCTLWTTSDSGTGWNGYVYQNRYYFQDGGEYIFHTTVNPTGGWDNIVYVHNRGETNGEKIYINGQFAGQYTDPRVALAGGYFRIGAMQWDNWSNLGPEDECVIYSDIKDQAWVTAEWNNGNGRYHTSSEPNIIAGWHFDESTGLISHDFVGGNNLTGTSVVWEPGHIRIPLV